MDRDTIDRIARRVVELLDERDKKKKEEKLKLKKAKRRTDKSLEPYL